MLKNNKNKKSFSSVFTKRLLLTLIIPIGIIFLLLIFLFYREVKTDKEKEVQMFTSLLSSHVDEELEKYTSIVETAAMDGTVYSLDYTVAEPYLLSLMAKSGDGIWSHFVICNQYGTEQAHTFGDGVRGDSLARQDCFQIAWDEERTVVSAPYINKSTGNYVLSISTPIYRKDKKVGVLIGFLNLDYISKILNEYPFSDNSSAFMLNDDGTVSGHPDSSLVLTQNWLTDKLSFTKEQLSVFTNMTQQKTGIKIAKDSATGSYNLYSYIPIGQAGLSLAVVTPIKEMYGVILYLMYAFMLALLCIFILCILSALFTSSHITKLLKWIVTETSLLSQGKTQLNPLKVSYSKTREIEELYQALLLLSGILEHMFQKLDTESSDLYHYVDTADQKINMANTSLEEILAVVEEFAAGIDHTCTTALNLSSNSEKNYTFTETIATYATEGSTLANQTMLYSNEVMKDMERGIANTTSMLFGMQERMTEAITDSKKIEEIKILAGEILEIADKTNLLSLNATIEAAHVKENGMGFGVIAKEIRNLSDHSQKTALHIDNLSQDILQTLSNLTASASQILDFLTENVIRDYEKFLENSRIQNKNTQELEWIMTKFSNHAVELKDEFSKTHQSISSIAEVMTENKTGIQDISSHTSSLSGGLQEMLSVMEACKTSANHLVAEVDKFR